MLSVGKKYCVGGREGMIMILTRKIDSKHYVLECENCTFYYQKGDCSLYPVKEFEQLTLF